MNNYVLLNKNECKHQYYRLTPYEIVCPGCGDVVPVLPMKSISLEDFKQMYPQQDVGEIIINDPLIR